MFHVEHMQPNRERESTMDRRAMGRRLLRRLAGDLCVCCSETTGLHWHHVNPETKLTEVTRLSGQRAFREASKCVLLCSECHHALHGGRMELILSPDSLWFIPANEVCDESEK